MIRAAALGDIQRLRDIERAAGAAFRDCGLPDIADSEPTSLPVLTALIRDRLCWVLTDEEDIAVALIQLKFLDGNVHVDQLAVHPDHAHQRLGAALLGHAEEWARQSGVSALTLTTFSEVPWNAPYYRRLGFVVVPAGDQGPGLRQLCASNAEGPLGAAPRVAMSRPV